MSGEKRKLKFLGRQTDQVRNTIIDFFIEPPTPGPRQASRLRHLIARYEQGGATDLPMIDGRREFATGIPDDWSEERVLQELVSTFDPSTPGVPNTKQ